MVFVSTWFVRMFFLMVLWCFSSRFYATYLGLHSPAEVSEN